MGSRSHFLALPAFLSAMSAAAAEPTASSLASAGPAGFGGPDAVPNRIEADRGDSDVLFQTDLLNPFYAWKDRLYEKTGYTFSAAYIANAFKADGSLPDQDDHAGGGVFRFSGFWELLGRGTDTTGTLVYLVEHRHGYTDPLPSSFALESLGYAGFSGIPFSGEGWHLTNLYWDQAWQGGKYEVFAGFLDVTDFVDVYPLTSPWTDFNSFVFSIGAATMDLPDDAAFGIAGGAWLTDSIYAMASIEDLNANPVQPFKGIKTFFNEAEHFKHLELGWTSRSWDQYYLDNLHLTLWHADDRDNLGIEDGWGAFLSYTPTFGDKWLAFVRGGFAEDGGSLLKRSVSIGGGYAPHGIGAPGAGSQLGFGANWGKPNDALFGVELNDQYTFEAYYRLQVTRELAITPSVQLLVNPALNPDRDQIWVAGLRARVAF